MAGLTDESASELASSAVTSTHCAPVSCAIFSVVFVTLSNTDRRSVQAFEEAVPAVPEIIQAQRLFGDPDFILHIITTDLAAYQRLYDEGLSTLPNVLRLRSTLVMKTKSFH